MAVATTNYGIGITPTIVENIIGMRLNDRSTLKIPMKSSASLFYGQFVTYIAGSAAAPAGSEFGIVGYTASKPILGIIKGFERINTNFPIQDDKLAQGTVTNAVLIGSTLGSWKYTAAATNDESNTVNAILECAIVQPIMPGDILEVPLVNNAGTAFVARGTTITPGTTGSSDNIGVGLSVNTTLPYALTESSASKLLIGLDFQTVSLAGNKPRNSFTVYVKALRSELVYSLPIV